MPLLPKQSLPDFLGHSAEVEYLNLPYLAGIILLCDTTTHFQLDLNDKN